MTNDLTVMIPQFNEFSHTSLIKNITEIIQISKQSIRIIAIGEVVLVSLLNELIHSNAGRNIVVKHPDMQVLDYLKFVINNIFGTDSNDKDLNLMLKKVIMQKFQLDRNDKYRVTTLQNFWQKFHGNNDYLIKLTMGIARKYQRFIISAPCNKGTMAIKFNSNLGNGKSSKDFLQLTLKLLKDHKISTIDELYTKIVTNAIVCCKKENVQEFLLFLVLISEYHPNRSNEYHSTLLDYLIRYSFDILGDSRNTFNQKVLDQIKNLVSSESKSFFEWMINQQNHEISLYHIFENNLVALFHTPRHWRFKLGDHGNNSQSMKNLIEYVRYQTTGARPVKVQNGKFIVKKGFGLIGGEADIQVIFTRFKSNNSVKISIEAKYSNAFEINHKQWRQFYFKNEFISDRWLIKAKENQIENNKIVEAINHLIEIFKLIDIKYPEGGSGRIGFTYNHNESITSLNGQQSHLSQSIEFLENVKLADSSEDTLELFILKKLNEINTYNLKPRVLTSKNVKGLI